MIICSKKDLEIYTEIKPKSNHNKLSKQLLADSI